jgi:hypothetical protein
MWNGGLGGRQFLVRRGDDAENFGATTLDLSDVPICLARLELPEIRGTFVAAAAADEKHR